MRRGVLIDHGVLLAGLISMFAVFPFLKEHFVLLRGLLQAFLTFILVGVVFAMGHKPRLRWVVGALAAATVSLGWADEFMRFPIWLYVARLTLNAVTLSVAALAILEDAVRAERVTPAKISGALSVYLLMGIIWATVFTILETLQPGSFQLGSRAANGAGEVFGVLFYYSFTTLSTVGYGDITPLRDGARALAMLEAVTGQMYLSVLVARLVGLHISEGGSQKSV